LLQLDPTEDLITLKLTYFAKKQFVTFGTVKIGSTKVKTLVIENANPYDTDVFVEKFPFKKNFSISEVIFWSMTTMIMSSCVLLLLFK